MIVLFLNTSSAYFHSFIAKDGVILASIYEKLDHNLSDKAIVLISQMLKDNDIKPNDVDKIYCVAGPGSFTGLRIGVTIAKVYSFGLNKKLYSLSSLFVMACSVVGYDYVIPIIDARRNAVFAGIYDKDYKCYMKDSYISIEKLKEKVMELDGNYCYVSMDDFSFEVKKFVPDNERILRFYLEKEVDFNNFVPEYLKLTEAEEHLNG